MAVEINKTCAPNSYHINPASELAIMVKRLWNAVKVPIAVAVSFLSVILLTHALEIPSVAAAYIPYNKKRNR